MIALDLYSGIGGASLGLKAAGFQIGFACDTDKRANRVYTKNIGIEVAKQRVASLNPSKIPHPELVFASINKKSEVPVLSDFIGQIHPRVIIFEFPTRMIDRTVKKIRKEINFEGYMCWCRIINMADFGFAQKRKILYIVGRRPDVNIFIPFPFPKSNIRHGVSSILETNPSPHLLISKKRLETIEKYNTTWSSKGFRYRTKIYTGDDITPTFPKAYHKDYRGILVDSGTGPRKLSALESQRLSGFPETFDFAGLPDKHKYRLLAQSSPPSIIEALARNIVQWANCS